MKKELTEELHFSMFVFFAFGGGDGVGGGIGSGGRVCGKGGGGEVCNGRSGDFFLCEEGGPSGPK